MLCVGHHLIVTACVWAIHALATFNPSTGRFSSVPVTRLVLVTYLERQLDRWTYLPFLP